MSRSASSFFSAPVRRALRVLGLTIRAFSRDKISRLGAALAFYTTLAVAPLLVISVAVTGVFFDDASARENVLHEIRALAGSPAAEALKSIENPAASAPGEIATIISFVALVAGGFGVFSHLQGALNSIWRIPATRSDDWRDFLRLRLFSIATVMMTGFLLLVSLVLSAAFTWLGTRARGYVQLPVAVMQLGNDVFSFVIVTVLFALIFKVLPDRKIDWRHVWLGAVVTAVLFTAGKSVLAVYLGHAHIVSAYGAAGSLVALLLWCYYAGQIVFFGAEFTRVTLVTRGGRNPNALDESPRRP